MEWNKETVLHFISLIKERPAIWNASVPEYKIKQKRLDAIDEVAQLMTISSKEVNAKWTVLRNQYSREKRKMAGSVCTGSGGNSVYTTKWFAYKKMETLMSSNKPTHSLSKFESDDSMTSMPSPCIATSPPPYTSTPSPPCTTTTPPPPPQRPLINAVRQGKKRENDAKNSVDKDAVQTFKVMREHNSERHRNMDDDLTSYGLYIAAHLRKFPPRLQSKARFEINNILYTLDMENLGEYSGCGSSTDNNAYSPGQGSFTMNCNNIILPKFEK